MYKFCLILFGVLFPHILSGNSADSLKLIQLENQIEILERSHDALILTLEKQKDSINYLRINQDFFHDAISSQTAIFSLISAGFFILFGLLTFAGFAREVNRLKKEYKTAHKKLITKFNSITTRLKEQEKRYASATGNINVLIANWADSEGDQKMRLRHLLMAAATIIIREDELEPCKINLECALTLMEEIKKQTTPIDLSDNSDELLDIIDQIYKADHSDESIKNYCAKIRLALSAYIGP